MTNTDLDVFMENLKRLLYQNSNKLIRDNRFITAKMPEIELLYKEFGCVIIPGLNNMNADVDHEAEDVKKFERRLVDVVHEAENAVDMFISSAILNFSDSEIFTCEDLSDVLDYSLNLKDVMGDIKSITEEMKRKFSNKNPLNCNNVQHLVESQTESPQVVETLSSKTTARVNPRATEHEQVIVGLEEDALIILDRLARDRKQLDVISIVGMGGLGKTTLATKLYNDQYVSYYFDVRGWITVSETYEKRDLLIGILTSMDKSVHESTREQKLSEMVYQSLKGRRYLIVIDDIWSAKAWDDLRLYFPDDNTGSRLLLTTRLTEVAAYAKPGGFTHHLQCLTEEKSWELLCSKTFRGYECPISLIAIGKHIAKKCQGLPLALVVIAGILEKGEKSENLWKKVAESVSSYIVDDPNGCLDTLSLSYDHLPHHLRNCFLYVGGFPEDRVIQTRRLIRLWMAEGFIKESAQRSLEEEAENYLMDLVDRNLLIVVKRRYDGRIKSCRLHDLLRELCLIKAAEEKFFKKTGMPESDQYLFSCSNSGIQRLFTDYKDLSEICLHGSSTLIRSVLCFSNGQQLRYRSQRWVPSFLLLRVLDLLDIRRTNLSDISILVHLRYLAVGFMTKESHFSVENLWNLQTLILRGNFPSPSLEIDMAKMVNLRHVSAQEFISIKSHFAALHNLQTLSALRLDVGFADETLRSFLNIKKLWCCVSGTSGDHELINLAVLSHLETLTMDLDISEPLPLVIPIRFPETLKRLTLHGLGLPWSFMSTIQQLPQLEILKLLDYSFEGSLWDTGDEQFNTLKYLKLKNLNKIQTWEASGINFPRLRKLKVTGCTNLKGIPLEIGDISTLEHIEIDNSNSLVRESVNKIQEEQHAMGNYDIHIKVCGYKFFSNFPKV